MSRINEFRVWHHFEKKFIENECFIDCNGDLFRKVGDKLTKESISHYDYMQRRCQESGEGSPQHNDGTYIYDGDILKLSNYSQTCGWEYADVIIGRVHNGFIHKYDLRDITLESYHSFKANFKTKIIGNIYDNPELLKLLTKNDFKGD